MGIGPRIVELLLALPRHSWRWLVLLGSRSADQRQELLCLIAKVEPYDLGTGTPNFRALRLGPRAYTVSVAKSFGGSFVWAPSLLTRQFQAEPCRCSR